MRLRLVINRKELHALEGWEEIISSLGYRSRISRNNYHSYEYISIYPDTGRVCVTNNPMIGPNGYTTKEITIIDLYMRKSYIKRIK